MAIEITPEETLSPIPRDSNFSENITVTVIPDIDGGVLSETIVSVSGELVGDSDNGLTFISIPSGLTISGKHTTAFNDIYTFTSKGTSNLTEIPTTTVGIDNLPTDANLFNLAQDGNSFVTRTFRITVQYYILSPNIINSVEFLITQQVINSLEAVRSFMANYNYNGSKG